jgi:hypothetical protein
VRSLEWTVTFLRLISPAARSGLLILGGTTLIAVPFGLQLGAAAIVTSVVVGMLMVSLGLAGTESSGRGTLPLSAQATYDRGIGVGLLVAALAFGIADDAVAAALFAVTGAVALIVASITSYSASPAA